MYDNVKLDDLVEVILDSGIKLVGKLSFKDAAKITLEEPCATMAAPMPNQQTGVMSYVTTMMPFRAVGDNNKADIDQSKIMSISVVSLPNYISMWKNNIKEYTLMWQENGTRDLTAEDKQEETLDKE